MTDARAASTSLPLTVSGLLRGDEIDGPGWMSVGADRLLLELPGERRAVAFRFSELDGMSDPALRESRTTVVTLFPAGGDALALSGDARLADAAALILRRATVLPELTRALRGVGARCGAPDGEHDCFFRPLLEARARAEQASGWTGQVAAFSPAALHAAAEAAVVSFAAVRFPRSAPDRRALEAGLREASAAMFARFERVEAATAAARDAADAVRVLRWRAWVAEVRALFAEADRCWLNVLPVLAAHPIPAATQGDAPRRAWAWRRLFGGGRRAVWLLAALAAGVAGSGA